MADGNNISFICGELKSYIHKTLMNGHKYLNMGSNCMSTRSNFAQLWRVMQYTNPVRFAPHLSLVKYLVCSTLSLLLAMGTEYISTPNNGSESL